MLRLVAGLGNPGPRYRYTRHNAGFLLVDRLAERWDADSAWRNLSGSLGVLAKAVNGVLLLKPGVFMNASGEALRVVADYYKLEPASVLVVVDDVSIPLGRLRLRSRGSHGGHNGLKSVSAELGTDDYLRLRLGVGGAGMQERRHPEQDLADYVLENFAPEELSAADAMLDRAAACIETVLQSGLDAAMNRFNTNETKEPKGE